jgi:hypothetical protein
MNLFKIEPEPCGDMGFCDCLAEVVEYAGLVGVENSESLGWLWWPKCAPNSIIKEHKLNKDILSGRMYNGARR